MHKDLITLVWCIGAVYGIVFSVAVGACVTIRLCKFILGRKGTGD